jgi:hemerythrin superfamily protein
MNNTTNWLIHDHHKYDSMLNECEMAAEMADWKDAIHLFNEFTTDIKLHMQLEDEVLYPIFQEKQTDTENEIAILQDEHENLVRLLRDLVDVIKTKNIDHFMESLLPLHKVMNEHNEHEEAVFQRLGNDSLLMRRDEIMERLSAVQSKAGHKPKHWGF